jgi:hypothetical protein
MATPTRADASEVNPTKRNSHCGMILFVDFVVSGMRFYKKKGNVEKRESWKAKTKNLGRNMGGGCRSSKTEDPILA